MTIINICIYICIFQYWCAHIYIYAYIYLLITLSVSFLFSGGQACYNDIWFHPKWLECTSGCKEWCGMVRSYGYLCNRDFQHHLFMGIYIYSDKTSKRGNRFVFDQCWFNYKLGGIVWPKLWIYPRLVVDISSTNDPKGPRWYPMAILSVPFLFGRPWYPKKPSKTHVESRNITI